MYQHIKEITNDDKMKQLIITEIPYEVVKAQLVKKMNEVYVAKNVNGIIEIRDETDREGLRIVVDIKKDANAEYIRDFFFKNTDLQVNYTYNMTAIADKRPVVLTLISALDYYIDHQFWDPDILPLLSSKYRVPLFRHKYLIH